jgi:hypothetical protein
MHGTDFFGAGSFDVPEPPGWALLAAGFAGLGMIALRRKQRGSSLPV